MNRHLIIPAIVAVAAFSSCKKAAVIGDTSFARTTFESLAKGDQKAAESIDWKMFRSLGTDVGQAYVAFATEEDKLRFREGFITQFASSFQSSGAKVEDFINWRVRDHDETRTLVAADSPKGGLLITVNKRDNQERVSAIEITQ